MKEVLNERKTRNAKKRLEQRLARLETKKQQAEDEMSLVKPARKIIQSGIYNTLFSAPTRSGKGVSCVIPTFLAYPGSMIVLDFKGENFKT